MTTAPTELPGTGLRRKAMACLAGFVKPGGRLLVIARSRPEDVPPEGPPWPLARSELQPFLDAGLNELNFQDFIVREEREIAHSRVEYVRPQ